ncbi:MAG: hypothetical protein IOD12_11530 [Silvanigrellales bacterium]|jgi:hypothetical protein|nr:hypothetical protein [Silvanigrellales bacterium]
MSFAAGPLFLGFALSLATLGAAGVPAQAFAQAGIRLEKGTGFLEAIELPIELHTLHCPLEPDTQELRVLEGRARFHTTLTQPAPGLRAEIYNITPDIRMLTPYTIRSYEKGAESEGFDIGVGLGIKATHENRTFTFLATPDSPTRNIFLYRIMKGDLIVEREFFEIDVSMKVVKQTSRQGGPLDCNAP